MSEPPIQKAEPVQKASEPAIVRFDDVSLYFGDTPGLDHVSFEMQAGETRVLFGAAGSGKTTLLKTALGLLKPDSGQVYLFGQDIMRPAGTGAVRRARPRRNSFSGRRTCSIR